MQRHHSHCEAEQTHVIFAILPDPNVTVADINDTVHWLALRKMSGSNLGLDTGYSSQRLKTLG